MNDPENLLAEALRAQASRAGGVPGGELSSSRNDFPLPGDKASDETTAAVVPTPWLLLVAAMLGLATGAVIGLLTLL